jgi:hypothetical protein
MSDVFDSWKYAVSVLHCEALPNKLFSVPLDSNINLEHDILSSLVCYTIQILPGLPIILTKTTGGFLQCFHVNVTTEP